MRTNKWEKDRITNWLMKLMFMSRSFHYKYYRGSAGPNMLPIKCGAIKFEEFAIISVSAGFHGFTARWHKKRLFQPGNSMGWGVISTCTCVGSLVLMILWNRRCGHIRNAEDFHCHENRVEKCPALPRTHTFMCPVCDLRTVMVLLMV